MARKSAFNPPPRLQGLLIGALALVMSACAADDEELDIEFRPAPDPECPGCTIKSGNFTIPDPGQGYTNLAGQMFADVSYQQSECPLYYADGSQPNPCEHAGHRWLADATPGYYEDEDLPMATGDDGDYDVTVEVTVRAPDGSKSSTIVPVTVNR